MPALIRLAMSMMVAELWAPAAPARALKPEGDSLLIWAISWAALSRCVWARWKRSERSISGSGLPRILAAVRRAPLGGAGAGGEGVDPCLFFGLHDGPGGLVAALGGGELVAALKSGGHALGGVGGETASALCSGTRARAYTPNCAGRCATDAPEP